MSPTPRRKAEELAGEQKAIADQVKGLGSPAERNRDQVQQLLDRKAAMEQKVGDLEKQIDRAAADMRRDEREAAPQDDRSLHRDPRQPRARQDPVLGIDGSFRACRPAIQKTSSARSGRISMRCATSSERRRRRSARHDPISRPPPSTRRDSLPAAWSHSASARASARGSRVSKAKKGNKASRASKGSSRVNKGSRGKDSRASKARDSRASKARDNRANKVRGSRASKVRADNRGNRARAASRGNRARVGRADAMTAAARRTVAAVKATRLARRASAVAKEIAVVAPACPPTMPASSARSSVSCPATREQLRGTLKGQGEDQKALDEILKKLKELDNDKVFQDPATFDRLQAQAAEAVKRFEFNLRRKAELKGNEVFLSGDGDVPEEFRKLVEQYYKSLSKTPEKKPEVKKQ